MEKRAGKKRNLAMTLKTLRAKAAEMWVAMAIDALGTTAGEFLVPVGPVTPLAVQKIMRSTESKGPKVVVLPKVYRPVADRMTTIALTPSATLVHIDVAVRALPRRPGIYIDDMTLSAVHLCVLTFQGVIGLSVMVKPR